MSKNELCKRLEKIESTNPQPTGHPLVIIKMWCPEGKTVHTGSKCIRIEPSNPEDAEL